MKRSAEQLWTADLSNMRFVGSAPDLQSLVSCFCSVRKKSKEKKKLYLELCLVALDWETRTEHAGAQGICWPGEGGSGGMLPVAGAPLGVKTRDRPDGKRTALLLVCLHYSHSIAP